MPAKRTNKVKAETECKTKVEVNTVDVAAPTPAKKPRKPRKKKGADGKPKGDKPTKTKRTPSTYALFVKAKYPSVKHLPCEERFKKIAEMWRKQKASA